MEMTQLFVLSIVLFFASIESKKCENGWVRYKNELCFKRFTKLLTYKDAQEFCASQGARGSNKCSPATTQEEETQENKLCPSTDTSKASLVKVTDVDLQKFLANYTHDVDDNVWLGSKYDNETNSFKWFDGEPMTYTNWQDGYPKNATGSSDACIELRPSNDDLSHEYQGSWQNVRCRKRNLVICQKTPSWTLDDAVGEIIKLQKEFAGAVTERNELREQLQVTRHYIQTISARVVPVGSIHFEYFGQPSPPTLWPDLTWEDISNAYGGLFFRVLGEGSEGCGETQTDCSPRITEMDTLSRPIASQGEYQTLVSIPRHGWSQYARAGVSTPGFNWSEGLKLRSESCEVRPRNQAIRVWKRTA